MSLSLNLIKIRFMGMFLNLYRLPLSSVVVHCCQILLSFYAKLGKIK